MRRIEINPDVSISTEKKEHPGIALKALSAAAFVGLFIVGGATNAQDVSTVTPTIPTYTLDKAEKDSNTLYIPSYDKDTGSITDAYYKVNYNNTQFGSGTEKSKDYKVKTSVGDIDITVNYDNPEITVRKENYSPLDNIDGVFVDNTYSDNSYSVGGGLRNESTIKDINAGFVGNTSISKTNAEGGGIFNNNEIHNINGYFISNTLNSNNSYAIGGAIANTGLIGDITADFISNKIDSNTGLGGAIYNSNRINSITGDFIGNSTKKGYAVGGAIYNAANGGANNPYIGDIKGNFIGNSSADSGGAIYNLASYDGSKIANIKSISGDFIGNTASSFGGAIWNNSQIGDIVGNFIKNNSQRGGAIYNYKEGSTTPVIKSITGDFIGNYIDVGGFSAGAAIFNEGKITEGINGNFIGNYINNNGGMGAGIYNVGNSTNIPVINGIKGDFVKNKITGNDYITGAGLYNADGAIINNKIEGNFIANELSGGSTVEGAGISNRNGATISDTSDGISISGNFIDNKVNASYYAAGAAILNYGSNIEGEIVGNFYKNSIIAEGDYATAEGGAVTNKYGTINKITGNFIENSVKSGRTAQGGALYTMGTIQNGLGSSNFIRNSVTSENGVAQGGAIYTYNSILGNDDVKLYFEGNSAISKNSNAQGGALYNLGNLTNKNLIADFIGNSAEGKSTSEGGAFWNNNTLTNLTANFIDNHVSGENFVAGGGLFSSWSGSIEKISGLFQNNYAKTNGTGFGAEGGGLYSPKANIDADFISNYVEADGYAKGGALFAQNLILNGDHLFFKNKAISKSKNAQGGAIATESGSSIEHLNGTFNNNSVEAGEFAMGGAVYSTSGIKNIDGTFTNSYAKANTKNATGGAIYTSAIDNVNGTFTNNTVEAKEYALGGAIYVYGGIKKVNGSFRNNNAISTELNADGGAINASNINLIEDSTFANNSAIANGVDGEAHGGAIYSGKINDIKNSVFLNNSSTFTGGAIYSSDTIEKIQTTLFQANHAGKNGGALFAENGIGEIVNSSFVGNSANGKGGAIYTTKDLKIVAKDGYTSNFNGNYTEADGVKDQNAIYAETQDGDPFATVTLNAQTNGKLLLNDNIDGVNYNLELTGDKSGEIYINNTIKNANISQNGATTYLNEASQLNYNNSLTINNGTMNIAHMGLSPLNLRSFANQGIININTLDINPATETVGRFVANSYGSHTGTINVNNLNILADPIKEKTNILFADSAFAKSVKYHGTNEYISKIYKYSVGYSPESGEFQFVRGGGSSGAGAFNPAVLSAPVNVQAGANATVNETFKYVFEHADAFTQMPMLERISHIKANQYALSTDYNNNLGNIATEFNNKAGWVRPYVTFEKMNLKNAPAVNATTYGTLVGFDSDFQKLKHGWTGLTTGYIGYNGSQLRYNGGDTTMNGGLLGLTQTFYKGNLWTALTLSAGATVGQTTTMYGKEDFTTLLAGVGSKTGYNFEFKEGKYIIQPIWFMSYTFANTFDYTNAAGVRINADPMHSIMLNPSVRFITNTKNGWQPYASIGMVWNAMNESSVKANNVKLPETSIKPYIEYGVGLQKRFKDRYTAFGQAMIRNGGRNGIAMTFGFRWNLGNEGKPIEKVKNNNTEKTAKVVTTSTDKISNTKTPRLQRVKGFGILCKLQRTPKSTTTTTGERKIIKQMTSQQKISKGLLKTNKTSKAADIGVLKYN